jgi:hypothetical protein
MARKSTAKNFLVLVLTKGEGGVAIYFPGSKKFKTLGPRVFQKILSHAERRLSSPSGRRHSAFGFVVCHADKESLYVAPR